MCFAPFVFYEALAKRPFRYPVSSFDEAKAMLEGFQSLEEGFVCWDIKNNLRVKMKTQQYVAMHHMRGTLDQNIGSLEALLTVILSGETDEIETYYPELKEKIAEGRQKIQKCIDDMTALYDSMKMLPIGKEFAAAALKHSCSRLLFSARKNGTSIADEFDKLPIEAKLKFILS